MSAARTGFFSGMDGFRQRLGGQWQDGSDSRGGRSFFLGAIGRARF